MNFIIIQWPDPIIMILCQTIQCDVTTWPIAVCIFHTLFQRYCILLMHITLHKPRWQWCHKEKEKTNTTFKELEWVDMTFWDLYLALLLLASWYVAWAQLSSVHKTASWLLCPTCLSGHLYLTDRSVCWGYRIHWIICRGVRPPLPMSVLHMTLNNLIVRLQ